MLYAGGVKEDRSSVAHLRRDGSRERIRVLIVDEQAPVRSGLRYVLLAFNDLEPVGAASSAEEALQLCAQARPDVVLMDPLVPGTDAAGTIRAICQRFPHTQVIALTSFRAESLVQEALEAGAMGYLLKNVSAEDLADAIRAAHAGRSTEGGRNCTFDQGKDQPPDQAGIPPKAGCAGDDSVVGWI